MANVADHPRLDDLRTAALAGDLQALKALADEGVPVATLLFQDEAPDLGSRVSALHVSARSRNFFHCLKFLVSLPGVNLEVQDKPEGRTPLLVAAENNKTEAVKLLVAKGALLQPNNGRHVFLHYLHDAGDFLNEGYDDMLKMLLGLCPEGLETFALAEEALLEIVTGDHIFLSEEGNPWYPPAAEMVRSIVEWLVREKGVSVNVKNSVGRTPLHTLFARAVGLDQGEVDGMVRLLLELGANVKTKDNDDATLMHALFEGDHCKWEWAKPYLELMLERGVPIDAQRKSDGKTVLHLACSHECGNMYEVIDFFWGLDPELLHAQDADGGTIIHAAAAGNSSSAVFNLLHRSWEDVPSHTVGDVDKNGWTPLHHAAWASISWLDETTTASLLLGKGADPLAKCKDGTTPLELCSSSPELRSLLLRAAEGNGAAAPGSCVASGLAALRAGGGDDLDLVLECSGEELRCHSLVLAAQSDYWKALCYGPMATPGGARRQVISEVSPETLRSAVDFCYAGRLPEDMQCPSALASLLRAASRFLMPKLQEATRVRLVGTLKPADESLFEVYEAAKTVGDLAVQELVERFLRRGESRSWLDRLLKDKEAWARLTERGAVTNELLQRLFAVLLARTTEPAAPSTGGRKRKWGW